MNEHKFLELSYALETLPLPDKFKYHAVRYKYFVRNSPRGHNCTYSKLTREQFLQDEKEVLLDVLKGIPNSENCIRIMGEL